MLMSGRNVAFLINKQEATRKRESEVKWASWAQAVLDKLDAINTTLEEIRKCLSAR